MACKQKVNQSYIMIIVATFDELMLRHDVCSLSFSEIHTWIKKRVLDTHGRHGGPKKLIGDQVQVFLTSSTRPPRHFGPKDGKRSSPTRFGGWIRTAEKASTCDGRHGRIRTRNGPLKYFMESLSSLVSNGSNLTSISIWSRPQSSILFRYVF